MSPPPVGEPSTDACVQVSCLPPAIQLGPTSSRPGDEPMKREGGTLPSLGTRNRSCAPEPMASAPAKTTVAPSGDTAKSQAKPPEGSSASVVALVVEQLVPARR